MSVAAGPWYIDDTFVFYQTAHDPATGGAVDADAVPDYRVYEQETGTAILTGSMALLDSGNTVGLYSESITLSAANGFEVGKTYVVYREVVVGGVTDTAEESFKVIAAVTAGTDPWSVSLPGAYGAGTAGKIVGDNLDAAVSTRSDFDSTTDKVTPIDVDGVTHESAMTAIMAALLGVASVAGATVTFYKRDGTTGKVEVTVDTSGVRLTSTFI